MHRNPFSYDMETFVKNRSLAPDYKLHFAEAMLQYERTMKFDRDPNPNKRADAKIQYALGLRNSVHKCWFLTRHSSNLNYNSIRDAVPEIPYPADTTLYRHDEYLKLSTPPVSSTKPSLPTPTATRLPANSVTSFTTAASLQLSPIPPPLTTSAPVATNGEIIREFFYETISRHIILT